MTALVMLILLLFYFPYCNCATGCVVFLLNSYSNQKKAICNQPEPKLTTVPEDLPNNLQQLSISHQNIRIIRNKQFVHLPLLHWLSITSSNVQRIEEGAFIKLSYLRYLILKNNSLFLSLDLKISLPRSIFLPLLELQQLDLSDNFLETIPDEFFRFVNVTLELLDLSFSKSDELIINEKSFLILGNLKQLYLHSSSIKMIDERVQHSLDLMTSLHTMSLHDNKFYCNCRIVWLIHWIFSRIHLEDSLTIKIKPTCKYPESLKGQTLYSDKTLFVDKTKFQCVPEAVTPNSSVAVIVGANVSLTCVFRNVDSSHTLIWLGRDGLLLTQTSSLVTSATRYRITETVGSFHKSTLTIVSVTSADSGVWRCYIRHYKARVTVTFRLLISQDQADSSNAEEASSNHYGDATVKSGAVSSTVYVSISISVLVCVVVLSGLGYYYVRYHHRRSCPTAGLTVTSGSNISDKRSGQTNNIANSNNAGTNAVRSAKSRFYKIIGGGRHNNIMTHPVALQPHIGQGKCLSPLSATATSLKLDDKVYDDVPLSSGFYINFTKKKNEQNFHTLNCLDCQNYSVGRSGTSSGCPGDLGEGLPTFWYLDDPADDPGGCSTGSFVPQPDPVPAQHHQLQQQPQSQTDESAVLTRVPSRLRPCPVHAVTGPPLTLLPPCPLHGPATDPAISTRTTSSAAVSVTFREPLHRQSHSSSSRRLLKQRADAEDTGDLGDDEARVYSCLNSTV